MSNDFDREIALELMRGITKLSFANAPGQPMPQGAAPTAMSLEQQSRQQAMAQLTPNRPANMVVKKRLPGMQRHKNESITPSDAAKNLPKIPKQPTLNANISHRQPALNKTVRQNLGQPEMPKMKLKLGEAVVSHQELEKTAARSWLQQKLVGKMPTVPGAAQLNKVKTPPTYPGNRLNQQTARLAPDWAKGKMRATGVAAMPTISPADFIPGHRGATALVGLGRMAGKQLTKSVATKGVRGTAASALKKINRSMVGSPVPQGRVAARMGPGPMGRRVNPVGRTLPSRQPSAVSARQVQAAPKVGPAPATQPRPTRTPVSGSQTAGSPAPGAPGSSTAPSAPGAVRAGYRPPSTRRPRPASRAAPTQTPTATQPQAAPTSAGKPEGSLYDLLPEQYRGTARRLVENVVPQRVRDNPGVVLEAIGEGAKNPAVHGVRGALNRVARRKVFQPNFMDRVRTGADRGMQAFTSTPGVAETAGDVAAKGAKRGWKRRLAGPTALAGTALAFPEAAGTVAGGTADLAKGLMRRGDRVIRATQAATGTGAPTNPAARKAIAEQMARAKGPGSGKRNKGRRMVIDGNKMDMTSGLWRAPANSSAGATGQVFE